MDEELSPPESAPTGLQERSALTTRAMTLRPASVNVEARTFEAVVATESRATVYDWEQGAYVEEILQAEGGEFPTRAPLLENHQRYSTLDVAGSAHDFTRNGDEWIGRATVVSSTGPQDRIEQVFRRIAEGHLRAVSIGYRPLAWQTVEPGQSATINGKTYAAGARQLRVTTQWRVFELSLTPIGADPQALIRTAANHLGPGPLTTERTMDEENVTPGTAERAGEGATAVVTPPTPTPTTRAAAPPANPAPTVSVDPVQAAVAAERTRAMTIQQIAGLAQVPPEMTERALAEGMSIEQASSLFHRHYTEQRQGVTPDVPTAGPAIHSRSSQTEYGRDALMAGLLIGRGYENPVEHWPTYNPSTGRVALVNRSSDDAVRRAVDRGDELRGMTLQEIIHRSLLADGVRCESSVPALIQAITTRSAAGLSTGTLLGVFTTSYSAMMLAAYESTPGTARQWCYEEDVADYKLNDRTRMEKMNGLQRRARGAAASNMTVSDATESYRVYEYAGDFSIDEQDIINDTFGALNDFTPEEMGEAAGRLVDDVVYAKLLENGAMRDTVALFHASHNNLLTASPLSIATLSAGRTKMALQTENGVNINTTPGFLIVPEEQHDNAVTLVQSEHVVYGGTTAIAQNNPNARSGLTVVAEKRLSNGVTNPESKAYTAGSTGRWFLASTNRRMNCTIGYVRQLGRRPRVRSYVLTQGKFGIGFDVQHSVGAKPMDWRTLQRNDPS